MWDLVPQPGIEPRLPALGEVDADLFVDLPREREKQLRGVDDVLGVELVGGDHMYNVMNLSS